MDLLTYIFANILAWLSIGTIVAVAVHLLDRKYTFGGFGLTLGMGILGAFLGSILANVSFGAGISTFTAILISTLSALILTLLARTLLLSEEEVVDLDPTYQPTKSLDYGMAYYSQVYPENKRPTSKQELDEYTNQLDYPVSKSDLLSFAEKEDISRKSLNKLEGLPEHIYENDQELKSALEKA